MINSDITAACFRTQLLFRYRCLSRSFHHTRDIAFVLDCRQGLDTCVGCIGTEMLAVSQRRVRPQNNYLSQYRFRLRGILPVRASQDVWQRNETFVDRQMTLATISPSRAVALGPTDFRGRGAFFVPPSMLCQHKTMSSGKPSSANSACQIASRKAALQRGRRCALSALRPSKRSKRKAFHWQPAHNRYMTPSNTWSALLGGVPPASPPRADPVCRHHEFYTHSKIVCYLPRLRCSTVTTNIRLGENWLDPFRTGDFYILNT